MLAALELYAGGGFEATTVADLAAKAGVTERTFFRYFADKREVLFDGSGEMQRVVLEAVADAPEGDPPLEVLVAAYAATAPFFDDRRDYAAARAEVIATNASLLERELLKLTRLRAETALALQARGVAPSEAALAAEVGGCVFAVGFARWVEDTSRGLAPSLRTALDELRAVTTTV